LHSAVQPLPAVIILRLVRAEGINEWSLRRAKKYHGIKSVKVGGECRGWGSVWVWQLPTGKRKAGHVTRYGNSGGFLSDFGFAYRIGSTHASGAPADGIAVKSKYNKKFSIATISFLLELRFPITNA
jgi:hypothetical protein